MKVIGSSPIGVECDSCGISMKAGLSTAVVACNAGQLKIFHDDELCSGRATQFLQGARTLTKQELANELTAALGL